MPVIVITALDADLLGVVMFLRNATFPADVLADPSEFEAQIHDADLSPLSDSASLWTFALRLGRNTRRAWTSSVPR
jgi:hypothetical protein